MVASIVTIAALASVSFGLSHTRRMEESASLSAMTNHHVNQSNAECDTMSSHMNMTQHMTGETCNQHENMHNQLNMTEHMQGMHQEGNFAAPHMENSHGSCHD